MSKLVWDASGEKLYETGVKQGVLYVMTSGAYGTGVAWNGLTGVTESPSGAETTDLYADDVKYLSMQSAETFGATVEAYTYPDEFAICDGSADLVAGVSIGQQTRSSFGLCYTTVVGNDTDGEKYGEKIHIIYGCKASPSEKAYATINDSPEAITFSWELSTTPVKSGTDASGNTLKDTATLVIDSTKISASAATNLKDLKAVLYGADSFSTTSTYAVGDYVVNSVEESGSNVSKLFRCTTAVSTAGAWDASKWTVVRTATSGPSLPLPAEIKEIMTVAG